MCDIPGQAASRDVDMDEDHVIGHDTVVSADDLPAAYGVYEKPPEQREDSDANKRASFNYINALIDATTSSDICATMVDRDVSLLSVKDLDPHHATPMWEIDGTTDVIIHDGPFDRRLPNAKIICQVKKKKSPPPEKEHASEEKQGTGKQPRAFGQVTQKKKSRKSKKSKKKTLMPRHEYQSFAELLCGSLKAKQPVFALLTNLCDEWQYMWLTTGEDMAEGEKVAGVIHHAKFVDKEKGLSALTRILRIKASDEKKSPCVTMEKILERAAELEACVSTDTKPAAKHAAPDAAATVETQQPKKPRSQYYY